MKSMKIPKPSDPYKGLMGFRQGSFSGDTADARSIKPKRASRVISPTRDLKQASFKPRSI